MFVENGLQEKNYVTNFDTSTNEREKFSNRNIINLCKRLVLNEMSEISQISFLSLLRGNIR